MTRSEPSDSRHVESFLEMLAAERGAAANTREAYAHDLKDFAGFLARRGRAVHQAGVADLRAYLGQLVDAGLASRSAARMAPASSTRAYSGTKPPRRSSLSRSVVSSSESSTMSTRSVLFCFMLTVSVGVR